MWSTLCLAACAGAGFLPSSEGRPGVGDAFADTLPGNGLSRPGRSLAQKGCTASTVSGFDCQVSTGIGSILIHYNVAKQSDSTAKMGVSMPSSTGWVGLGFPTSPGQMVGATAVIATTSASNGVGIYDLNSQDVSGVNEVSGSSGSNSPTITNLAASRTGGKTVATFERGFDSTFTPSSKSNYIVAMSDQSQLGLHSAQGSVQLVLTDSSGVSSTSESSSGGASDKERWAHGWLEAIAFGAALPLGITAVGLKPAPGAVWFHLHRLFNVLAVLSATAGIIIAWIKFDSIDSVGTVGSAHKAFAYLAWILIIILPIAGIIRPKKPEPGLKSSKLRLMWEIGHKGLGYICLLLGIAAVFTGLRTLAKLGNMDSDKWYWIQIAVLGAIGLVWLTLLLVRCATGGRSKGKDAPASHSSLNGHGRAGGGELGVGPNGHRSSGSDSMRKAQGERYTGVPATGMTTHSEYYGQPAGTRTNGNAHDGVYGAPAHV